LNATQYHRYELWESDDVSFELPANLVPLHAARKLVNVVRIQHLVNAISDDKDQVGFIIYYKSIGQCLNKLDIRHNAESTSNFSLSDGGTLG